MSSTSFIKGFPATLQVSNYQDESDPIEADLQFTDKFVDMWSPYVLLAPEVRGKYVLSKDSDPVHKACSRDGIKAGPPVGADVRVICDIEGYTALSAADYDRLFPSSNAAWTDEAKAKFTNKLHHFVVRTVQVVLGCSDCKEASIQKAEDTARLVPSGIHLVRARHVSQLKELLSIIGHMVYAFVHRGYLMKKNAHDADKGDHRPSLMMRVSPSQSFAPLFKKYDANRTGQKQIPLDKKDEPVREDDGDDQDVPNLEDNDDDDAGDDDEDYSRPGAAGPRGRRAKKRRANKPPKRNDKRLRNALSGRPIAVQQRQKLAKAQYVADDNPLYTQLSAEIGIWIDRCLQNEIDVKSVFGEYLEANSLYGPETDSADPRIRNALRWRISRRIFEMCWELCWRLVDPDRSQCIPLNFFVLMFSRIAFASLKMLPVSAFPYEFRTVKEMSKDATKDLDELVRETYSGDNCVEFIDSLQRHAHILSKKWNQDLRQFNILQVLFKSDDLDTLLQNTARTNISSTLAHVFAAHYKIQAEVLSVGSGGNARFWIPMHGLVLEKFADVWSRFEVKDVDFTEDTGKAYKGWSKTCVLDSEMAKRVKSVTELIRLAVENRYRRIDANALAAQKAKDDEDKDKASPAKLTVGMYVAKKVETINKSTMWPELKQAVIDSFTHDAPMLLLDVLPFMWLSLQPSDVIKERRMRKTIANRSGGGSKNRKDVKEKDANKWVSLRTTLHAVIQRVYGNSSIPRCYLLEPRMSAYGMNALLVRQPRLGRDNVPVNQLTIRLPCNVHPLLMAFGMPDLVSFEPGTYLAEVCYNIAHMHEHDSVSMFMGRLFVENADAFMKNLPSWHTLVSSGPKFRDLATKNDFRVFGCPIMWYVAVRNNHLHKSATEQSFHVQYFMSTCDQWHVSYSARRLLTDMLAACSDREFVFRMMKTVIETTIQRFDKRLSRLAGRAFIQHLVQPDKDTKISKDYPELTHEQVSNMHRYLVRRGRIPDVRIGTEAWDFVLIFSVYMEHYNRGRCLAFGVERKVEQIADELQDATDSFLRKLDRLMKRTENVAATESHSLARLDDVKITALKDLFLRASQLKHDATNGPFVRPESRPTHIKTIDTNALEPCVLNEKQERSLAEAAKKVKADADLMDPETRQSVFKELAGSLAKEYKLVCTHQTIDRAMTQLHRAQWPFLCVQFEWFTKYLDASLPEAVVEGGGGGGGGNEVEPIHVDRTPPPPPPETSAAGAGGTDEHDSKHSEQKQVVERPVSPLTEKMQKVGAKVRQKTSGKKKMQRLPIDGD